MFRRYPPLEHVQTYVRSRDADQDRKNTRTIFRDQRLNADFLSQTFRAPPGYPGKFYVISCPKVWFPWVLKDIPNFLTPKSPTPAEETRIKKFGFGFFFVPEFWPRLHGDVGALCACDMHTDNQRSPILVVRMLASMDNDTPPYAHCLREMDQSPCTQTNATSRQRLLLDAQITKSQSVCKIAAQSPLSLLRRIVTKIATISFTSLRFQIPRGLDWKSLAIWASKAQTAPRMRAMDMGVRNMCGIPLQTSGSMIRTNALKVQCTGPGRGFFESTVGVGNLQMAMGIGLRRTRQTGHSGSDSGWGCVYWCTAQKLPVMNHM